VAPCTRRPGKARDSAALEAHFLAVARGQAIPPEARRPLTAGAQCLGHFQDVGGHGIGPRLKHHGIIAAREEALEQLIGGEALGDR
jgi:hypothetical protein